MYVPLMVCLNIFIRTCTLCTYALFTSFALCNSHKQNCANVSINVPPVRKFHFNTTILLAHAKFIMCSRFNITFSTVHVFFLLRNITQNSIRSQCWRERVCTLNELLLLIKWIPDKKGNPRFLHKPWIYPSRLVHCHSYKRRTEIYMYIARTYSHAMFAKPPIYI